MLAIILLLILQATTFLSNLLMTRYYVFKKHSVDLFQSKIYL